MTFRVQRPSKRAVRNQLAFMGGAVNLEAPAKRGPQAESLTNKAIAAWKRLKTSLFLERNKRRLATPPGMTAPIMLGWMAEGSSDWIGWESIEITPAMVGKRVAIFVGIEAKRPGGGTVSAEQEAFLNSLTDAGGIAIVAHDAQEADEGLARWHERMVADER